MSIAELLVIIYYTCGLLMVFERGIAMVETQGARNSCVQDLTVLSWSDIVPTVIIS